MRGNSYQRKGKTTSSVSRAGGGGGGGGLKDVINEDLHFSDSI